MIINRRPNRNIFLFFILLLLVISILTWQAVFHIQDDNLQINFLDVGQGDSIHIRKNNIDILIDAGDGKRVLEELGKTMPFYDRTIECVFLTHPHLDHYGGMIELVANYEIEKLYMSDAVVDSDSYVEFIRQLEINNIAIDFIHNYEKIDIVDDLYFIIFNPTESYIGKKISNVNNTSIVKKMNYKNISVLFTGDAENDLQSAILSIHGNRLKSDIYKVSHHGSKNATNHDFLQIVNPEIAVIPVGTNNRFGHPHDETLNLLELFEIRTFRTDIDGTITFISDGINFWRK